jgi:hypothetical protein
MKLQLSFLVVLVLLCLSCRQHRCDSSVSYPLHVDLQESYGHSAVRMYVDGSMVYDALTTSNHALGLAGGVVADLAPGRHELRVIVDNRDSASVSFPVGSELYIGVGHSVSTGEVRFDVTDRAFVYE